MSFRGQIEPLLYHSGATQCVHLLQRDKWTENQTHGQSRWSGSAVGAVDQAAAPRAPAPDFGASRGCEALQQSCRQNGFTQWI